MLNFKEKYIADMEQISPGAALLADTRALLLTPPRRTWGWKVGAIACAAVVLATALPFTLQGNFADQPALLADSGGAAVYDGEAIGLAITEDSAPTGRSAIQTKMREMTEEELDGLGEMAEILPQAPAGMMLSSAVLDEADGTLFVDYSDNGYDCLTVRVRPADETEINAALPAEDLTAEVIADYAKVGDQGAKYLNIVASYGEYLIEYTAHSANMDGIWQAISGAKIFN